MACVFPASPKRSLRLNRGRNPCSSGCKVGLENHRSSASSLKMGRWVSTPPEDFITDTIPWLNSSTLSISINL
ncbi:hypothetical protein HPB50_014976 [Hyalomma asiaticum]|uniref:Uncharacterized protein n=1 Tax=Hyalomma asiaticum TaxID=266040 RepID=A0ACB7RLE3_HYAAI|nr:hypothetical protein HPB50_014976 [Hyalomma asiaticum]